MDEIRRLKEIVESSSDTVFFGGAGVSTESGIPDFRSETGLYKARSEYGRSPEEMISHSFFMHEPKIFFEYYRHNLIYSNAEPNNAHKALAVLEQNSKLSAVVTQNIDGLHQLAGSKNIFELHGSVHRNYCMDCDKRFDLDWIMDTENDKDGVPVCDACGGRVRPDVVLYEETLDDSVISGAVRAISFADTLIVGGTSLVVYPAAGFLGYFSGKNLLLINKGETSYDDRASLVIREPIGEVMSVFLEN